MQIPELSEQEQISRNSLEEIKKLGINPYPPELFEISHNAAEITAGFEAGQDWCGPQEEPHGKALKHPFQEKASLHTSVSYSNL